MIKFSQAPGGRASFPYKGKTLDDLPASLRQLAEPALGPKESINSIFVAPAQWFAGRSWFGGRYVPDQALLFTPGGVLHVQAPVPRGQEARVTYLRGDDLLYAQLSLLLLYGRLELAGQVSGALARVVVEFNTVSDFLLRPPLREFLRATWGQTETEKLNKKVTARVMDELERLPSLKFKNGLRIHGLQPAECLLGFVFQPGLWTPWWRFFWRQVSATTLLALTDRQLIILEEERNGQRTAYGWIVTFCPRVCLAGLEYKPGEQWHELHVRLAREGVATKRQVILAPETALAWQELWRRYSAVSITEAAG